ncbi:MAG: hypothetical protein ABI896_04125 [Actinomycetota bacterium]
MLVAALASLAFGAAAPPAAAKAPCWRQVIEDWVDNDSIDGTYAIHCYNEAIAHVPEDLRVYSGIVDDITAARQQAGRNPRQLSGHNAPPAKNTAGTPDKGLFTQGFDKLGARNVDTVPLPLLILAVLSLLLIGAGAAGLVSRRLRARKAPG